ncbi:TIGR00266 family protein [Desulfurococcus amylolyticus]|uniref:TIGR00266 family protein n=1 Tax=Desulfurococcus amylolyticus DSM 16532 TaxID=768672 RepID=I3XQY1_DESAM|nr:TIGR00266 family protein [Desulfurococcus amylolyticus]AFL66355.1 TIGR00266 family protein [Desulfurococcus amylolyticus DSM 16532]
MDYKVEKSPAYSILKVSLDPGESITIEAGSYMLHKGNVKIETTTGGVLSAIARAVAGGESLFLDKITALTPSEVWIAPNVPGDIVAIDVDGELIVQDTGYLAHAGGFDIGIAWRGLRGLLAEGELFWLRLTGKGTVFVNSYGAIEELVLKPGEKATIDNFHLVAMEPSVKWSIKTFSGLKSTILGGEGLVVEVEGPGKLWVQTRILPVFAQILSKYIRVK